MADEVTEMVDMAMTRRRLAGDAGVTMTELLVTMLILTGVMAATAVAISSGRRVFSIADDDATGVLDLRPAVERLGRDVRNARQVDPGATRGSLALWIDSNSDYRRQPSEVVTWSIVNTGDHFDVRRQVGTNAARTQASTVVSAIAFCYRTTATAACVNPDDTPVTAAQASTIRVVDTTMTYDPRVTGGATQRQVTFAERLRNVA